MMAMADEVLATLERQCLAHGAPVGQVDGHVAEVLGVPPDHLAVWQLVEGAIASYSQTNGLTAPPATDRPVSVTASSTTVEQLRRLWEHLGAIHRAASAGVADPERVRDQARELIGELFVLTDSLLADPDVLDDTAMREGAGRE